MAAEITLEDIRRQQAVLTQLGEQLSSERDPQRIVQLATELERAGAELDRIAREFERVALAKAGPAPRGGFEVVLTAGQRERIRAATGVDLPSVWIEDKAGVLTRAMPSMDPAQIERLALDQAKRRAVTEEMEVKGRQRLEAILADIESQGGAVKERLDELRRDPSWLGGLLHKRR